MAYLSQRERPSVVEDDRLAGAPPAAAAFAKRSGRVAGVNSQLRVRVDPMFVIGRLRSSHARVLLT
jgi:hypothetical protein